MTIGVSAAQLQLSKLSDVSAEYCSWRTYVVLPLWICHGTFQLARMVFNCMQYAAL